MDNIFPILAVETSGDMCSVAVIKDENSFVEMNYMEKHIHSKKIIEMIDSVLKSSGNDIRNIKAIAVSGGPGSFTGLRIGFSSCKGLAFGSGIPMINVPTFEALAYQLAKNIPDGIEFIISNKASIEEIYFSKFEIRENKYRVLSEVEIIQKNDFEKKCSGTKFIFGNAGGNPVNINAASVGMWAYLFGKDLLTFNYDFMEPEYLGNPFLKKKESKGD